MESNEKKNKKREINPLGVIALVMGCLYSIPLVAFLITQNQVLMAVGLLCVPLAAISFMAAKTNWWKMPFTNIKIQFLGHSCFKLTAGGQDIFIDPYSPGSVPGLKRLKGKANYVLSTHDHKDHNAVDSFKIVKSKRPLPFEITEIKTYHDDRKGAKRGEVTGYLLDNGEHRIVHLGDIGCELTQEQIEMIKGVDVLMIPVGGKYTINDEVAARIAVEVNPNYILPMHFRGYKYGLVDIDMPNKFPSLCREKWLKKNANNDKIVCPTIVTLVAKNSKEKGISTVELRSNEEKEKDRAKKNKRRR